MINAKSHLRNISRTKSTRKTRLGCLRLDMNESVTGLPYDFVKRIIRKVTPDMLASYPEYKDLQEKIARYNNLKTSNICLSNGSDACIKYIFDAYISSGDKVLMPRPTFAMYSIYCNVFKAEPLMVTYKSDLSFPVDKFIRMISKGVKLVVLVNPNNPTGTVLEQKQIMQIIKKASRVNCLVVVDEAYFYFYTKTVIGQIRNFRNLIVLRTFSKLCGLAAVRLGYAAADKEIVENLHKVKPTFDVNSLGVLFVSEFLEKPDIVENLLGVIASGKAYLIRQLRKSGISFKDTSANFILINCRKKAKDIIRLLAEQDILVSGNFRDDFLRDYIRVTLGSEVNMKKFWMAFIKIYGNLF